MKLYVDFDNKLNPFCINKCDNCTWSETDEYGRRWCYNPADEEYEITIENKTISYCANYKPIDSPNYNRISHEINI